MAGRRFSVKTADKEWIQDWVDAEVVERVERIEAQVASLDIERDRLEADLDERVEVIEARVAILDAERTELEAEFARRVRLIEAQVESLDHERALLENEHAIEGAEESRALREPREERVRQEMGEEEAGLEPALPRGTIARVDSRKLALLSVFVLGPWALIAALVYLMWQLLG
jgi:hypothetical protein